MAFGARDRGRVRLNPPGPMPQHEGCEAIGTVLNGSHKTRWHTKRAGAMWVLGSLTGFSASLAVGAASLPVAIVALGFAAATTVVYRIERKQRRLRGSRLAGFGVIRVRRPAANAACPSRRAP